MKNDAIGGFLARHRLLLVGVAAVCVYLIASVYRLDVPGVYYDELLQVLPAMSALGYNVGSNFLNVPSSLVRLGTFRFPLLIMPYTGSLEAALFVPVLSLLGVSVFSIRLTYVVLGAIALVLTLVWTKQVSDARVAAITTLVVALDASYLFFVRSDHGPIATMMILKLLMLIALTYWWQTGRWRGFLAGAFLAGLGVYDKANFIWFLAAGAVTMGVFAWREVLARLRPRPRYVFAGALLFLVGAAPLVLYVVLSRGGPFRAVFSGFGKTAFGVNNSDVLGNLLIRSKSLYEILSGYEALNLFTSSFAGVTLAYERINASFQPWLVVLAFVAALGVAVSGSKALKPRARFSLGSSLLILVILAASCFTPTTLSSNHLLLIYPFPAFLVANSAVLLWDWMRQKSARQTSIQAQSFAVKSNVVKGGIAFILAVAIMGNLLTIVQNYRILNSTGGVGMWSTAIYELANYLGRESRPVSALDWGLDLNLLMLAKGRVAVSNDWQKFLYPSSDSPEMEALLRDPDRLFLLHAPKYAGVLAITEQDFPRETLFSSAAKLGLSLECVKTFYQSNGEPIYQVFAVAR